MSLLPLNEQISLVSASTTPLEAYQQALTETQLQKEEAFLQALAQALVLAPSMRDGNMAAVLMARVQQTLNIAFPAFALAAGEAQFIAPPNYVTISWMGGDSYGVHLSNIYDLLSGSKAKIVRNQGGPERAELLSHKEALPALLTQYMALQSKLSELYLRKITAISEVSRLYAITHTESGALKSNAIPRHPSLAIKQEMVQLVLATHAFGLFAAAVLSQPLEIQAEGARARDVVRLDMKPFHALNILDIARERGNPACSDENGQYQLLVTLGRELGVLKRRQLSEELALKFLIDFASMGTIFSVGGIMISELTPILAMFALIGTATSISAIALSSLLKPFNEPERDLDDKNSPKRSLTRFKRRRVEQYIAFVELVKYMRTD